MEEVETGILLPMVQVGRSAPQNPVRTRPLYSDLLQSCCRAGGPCCPHQRIPSQRSLRDSGHKRHRLCSLLTHAHARAPLARAPRPHGPNPGVGGVAEFSPKDTTPSTNDARWREPVISEAFPHNGVVEPIAPGLSANRKLGTPTGSAARCPTTGDSASSSVRSSSNYHK